MQQAEHGNREPDADGRIPEQVLAELISKISGFVDEQYECWRDELLPALEAESVRVLGRGDLRPEAREYIESFYAKTVEPILTPVPVDPSHPFPHVLNKALCIAFLLRRRRGGNGKPYFGVLTVPRALPRLLRVPTENDGIRYAFLQDIISTYASKLYRGYEILASAAFRITRNSNLYLEQEESRSLLETR